MPSNLQVGLTRHWFWYFPRGFVSFLLAIRVVLPNWECAVGQSLKKAKRIIIVWIRLYASLQT